MKQEIKGKPHFKGILDVMVKLLIEIINSPEKLESFKLLGSVLEDYDLPKKKGDVYFIVEGLEIMIKTCMRVEGLQDVQKYLADLIKKIRVIFLKNLLIDFFISKEDVKIILNDGTEVVIIGNSLNMMADPITGRTPEKKDVKIYFHDIKLGGGVSAVEEAE